MPPPLRTSRRPGVLGIASLMRWRKRGKIEKGWVTVSPWTGQGAPAAEAHVNSHQPRSICGYVSSECSSLLLRRSL